MGKNDEYLDDLQGVVDDDGKPDVDDVETDDEEQDVSIEDIIAGLGATDDDDEDEVDEEEEEVAVEEEDAVEDDSSNDAEAELPDDINEIVDQRVAEELNRIVPERLKRDRKTQQVVHLEQLTGMTIEGVTAQVIQNMVEAKAEELGISEEEARSIISDKIENAGIKAQQANKTQEEAEISAAMQQVKYSQDKLAYAKKPKLARVLTKDILKEIDVFTQSGKVLTFEDGMKYVLGEKLATGELLQKAQAGAEKKALKNIQQRGKAAPQSRKTGAAKSDNAANTLTKEQRTVAASLGITSKEDLKEYAAEIAQENKRKQRKGR
ncbi:MAG: hypothetical protein WCQ59_08355 [Candidatus Cloacimonadaceae bacterium]